MVAKSIIEKVKKLLSLANSSNEYEAKLATSKANELLIKHNLDMQQIKDKTFDYETEEALRSGLTFKSHQKLIAGLLKEYFFVRVVISRKFMGYSSGNHAYYRQSRAQYQKIIQIIGTKENCEIAGYIFSYLDDMYPKLWLQYKKQTEIDHSAKISYYKGLTRGIGDMLYDTRWRVQQETGLVLVNDHKLEEYVDKRTSGKDYGGINDKNSNSEVYKDGIQDGKKVTLRKPIQSDTTKNIDKYLNSSKK